MKRVLITGANSYIGTSFQRWAERTGRGFEIDTLEVVSDRWKGENFSAYDAVLHVAAIVHVRERDEGLYQAVNCDLACAVAEKAKCEGVGQFVFLSTMAVFGGEAPLLTAGSVMDPQTPYARSKHAAEQRLQGLRSGGFRVAILRPPFVYGHGCRGNYVRLRKLALLCPAFPKVRNRRSMIYIDNLTEFLCLCILNGEDGVFHPQNDEYVCTSDMVRRIREANGRRTWLVPVPGWLVGLLKRNGTFRKVFGDLVYDREMSGYRCPYAPVGFGQSVMEAEGRPGMGAGPTRG